MSKGSPIVPIRIPDEVLHLVDATIEKSWETRSGPPWTRSAFIISAIREKIAKMERSREWRRFGRQLAPKSNGGDA